MRSFQSTRPHGARPVSGADWAAAGLAGFNPRARTGRDEVNRAVHEHALVSIHAPARGATESGQPPGQMRRGFNPRARTGRDLLRGPGPAEFKVSIHAPARGATASKPDQQSARFQSTRPHGARLRIDKAGEGRCRFQSTRPHGARLCNEMQQQCTRRVSIHAPARGATWLSCPRPGWFDCFNPRARTGRDPPSRCDRSALGVLQSTRPHGARRR